MTGEAKPGAVAAQSPGRTFEDIERRQREVHALELAAVRTLVVVLRELAVALPPESQFPLQLAASAQRLSGEVVARHERYGGSPALAAGCALWEMDDKIKAKMRRWRPEDES